MEKEKFSLKDQLFNPVKVKYLANLIKKAHPQFESEKFTTDVLEKFPELELKQRISYMADRLKKYLPADYKKAVTILVKALPEPLDPNRSDDDFGDFIFAPFSDFVATYGCDKKYLNVSLQALAEMTMRFSAEDSIRYFINQFPEESFEFMQKMAASKNYHQRRLASEGSRLSLPWSQKIHWLPEKIISILDHLYFDKTRYVNRSVANNLNDISKVKPDLVLSTLERWEKSKKQNNKEMNFIIKHALRTLLKKGNQKALSKLGFTEASHIKLNKFCVQERVVLGNNLEFSFQISTSDSELGKLRLEYKIYYQKANGQLNPKIFKIAESNFSEQKKSFVKKHNFKLMTTRKHYLGCHEISIVINGKELERKPFLLA